MGSCDVSFSTSRNSVVGTRSRYEGFSAQDEFACMVCDLRLSNSLLKVSRRHHSVVPYMLCNQQTVGHPALRGDELKLDAAVLYRSVERWEGERLECMSPHHHCPLLPQF